MRPRSLTIPLSASLLFHVAAIAAIILARPSHERMPPVYAVTMIPAPAGPRAAGVVEPAKAAPEKPPPPKPTTTPSREAIKRTPVAKPQKATPAPARQAVRDTKPAEQAKAGGGPEGGKGTDVAGIDLKGLQFPYPAYLTNIVRQITIEFGRWNGSQSDRTDIQFIIAKDGSVIDKRFVNTSSSTRNFEFKTKAMAAIEAVGRKKLFGPLPDGFPDDVLPVVFSFDPKIVR
jgi:protein TonB